MILKFSLPGYKSFIAIPFKMGLLGAVVMTPLCYFTDVQIVHGNTAIDLVVIAISFFIVGFVSFWLVSEVQFWKRRDEFLFQGYFILKYDKEENSAIMKTLDKIGYKKMSADGAKTLMKRESWPGKDFTVNPIDFRPYYVELTHQNEQIVVKFVVREWENQFDGKQIAYKAAQEFKRSFISN